MVGGFVEDENIHAPGGNGSQGDAAFLPSRKSFYCLGDHAAVDSEGTEEVAHLLLGHARTVLDADRIENRFGSIEAVEVLVVVTNFDMRAQTHLAFVGRLLPQKYSEQCCFAAAVGPDNAHAPATLDLHGEVFEQGPVVSLGQVGGIDDVVAGTRRLAKGNTRSFDKNWFVEAFELVELFLAGSGLLVELSIIHTLDVLFLPADLFLLRLEGLKGRLVAFAAESPVVAEVARVVFQSAAGQFNNARGDAVEKGAVVADNKHALAQAHKVVFQPT